MVELIIPNEKYLDSYIEAKKEYDDNNITTYSFSDTTNDIFKKFDNYRNGINIKEGRVPSDYYWLVDGIDFIGEISIRHTLNDDLLRYGGHIGFGIRYSKWGQGYGNEILRLGLKKANEFGLKKVLVTCDDNNLGSAKIIENNNGILENKVTNIVSNNQVLTRRYWIEL